MSSKTRVEEVLIQDTNNFSKLIAPVNTKGTIYIVNNSGNVGFLTPSFPADQGKIITIDATAPLLVSWKTKPTGIASGSNIMLLGYIRSQSATTNYSAFIYSSVAVASSWNSSYCESIPVSFSAVINRILLNPEGSSWWGASGASPNVPGGQSYTFTIGKLTGRGDISAGGTFTPYSVGTGITTTVNSTNGLGNVVIITNCNIAVSAGDQVAIRCVNSGTGYERDVTFTMWVTTSYQP